MPDEEIDQTRLAEALRTPVHQGERYVPFGELTLAEAEDRAQSLASVGGWGPLARAAKVAHAWRDLAVQMRQGEAATVADLEPVTILRFAEYLWVIAPKEGLI